MKTLNRLTDMKVNGIAGSHLNSRADRFLGRFKKARIVLLSGALNDTIMHLAETLVTCLFGFIFDLLRRWKMIKINHLHLRVSTFVLNLLQIYKLR